MMILKKDNLFFLLSHVFIYLQVFSESQLNSIPSIGRPLMILRYGILVALFAYILSDKISGKKNILINSLIFLFVVLSNTFLVSGGTSILSLFLIVWASKGKSLDRIFRNTIIDLLISHFFIALLCSRGILNDDVNTRWLGNYAGAFFSGESVRHSMGFLVHNQIPTTFLLVTLLYIVYRSDLLTLTETAVLIVVNVILYVYFGSRTTLLLVIVSLMVYWLIRSKRKLFGITKRNYATKSGYWVYPILCLGSFILTLAYNNKNRLLSYLNLFFNNRLTMGHQALAEYGVSLIGYGNEAGTYSTLANATVDNGYILVYLQRGIIILVAVLVLYELLISIALKQKNMYLIMILVFLAFENTINAHLFTYKLIPLYCILLNREDMMLTYEHRIEKNRRHLPKFKIKK